jgi:hypothetical protein
MIPPVNCYYHPDDRPAVALCTNCSRGVCTACAAEVPNGTACVNRCEAEVRIIKETMERAKTGYQKAAGLQSRNAVLYLLMAAAMAFVGLLTLPGGWVMVGLAVVMVIGAGFSYSASKKFRQIT